MKEVQKVKTGVRMRPRFRLDSPMNPVEIADSLKEVLSGDDSPVRGMVVPGHAVLSMHEKDRKPWSPILTLEINPREDEKGSTVKGLYGPAPGIWTLFMFLYVTIGFSIFILLFWGLAYYSLGEPAPMLWGLIPAVLLLIGLWASAQTGQRLSHHQIVTLHGILLKALDQEGDGEELLYLH